MLVIAGGWELGGGGEAWRATASHTEFLWGGDKNALKLDSG